MPDHHHRPRALSVGVAAPIAHALGDGGYQVVPCATATEALAELQLAPAEVVVIDRARGDALHDRLVRHIEDNPHLAEVRVVVLGQPRALRDARRVRVLGADATPDEVLCALAGAGEDRPRVLVVDDSPTFRARTRAALAAGHEVVEAATGEEALRLLAGGGIDAVLLDKSLPSLSGLDTCRAIRSDAALSTLPVLMVTADDEQDSAVDALHAGADDFIPKGASDAILLARLRAHLRRWRAETSSRDAYANLREARGVADARAEMLDVVNRQAGDLKRVNDDLERFAAVAAHDLQEPLRMISLHLDLIDRRDGRSLSPASRDALAVARDAATRMRTLVARVLDYTRTGWAEVGVEPPIATRPVVDEAIANLSQAIAAAGARINIDELPTIAFDRDALRQVFQNLIGNAVKYRDATRPLTVRIAAERRDQVWRFTVADNGIGIDPTHHLRIFRMFSRAERDQEGSGIGLAVCRRHIIARAGEIGVESTTGVGSTFWFTARVVT